MAEKKGGGGKLQEYDDSTGQYGGSSQETAAQMSKRLRQEIPKDKLTIIDVIRKYSDEPARDFAEYGLSDGLRKSDGRREDGLSASDEKTTKEFVDALSQAKDIINPENAWRVSSPAAKEFDEEHPNAKKYVTKGGSTIAITPDGDIVGVCKKPGDTVNGSDMLAFAVKNGGKKLDAFSKLWRFYSKNGFEPVSWTPFDEQYAPSGWDAQRDEKEPVIFWKYTGKYTAYKSSDEFLNNVAPSKSYDDAKRKRDAEVKA
jgi:hypothetical protein